MRLKALLAAAIVSGASGCGAEFINTRFKGMVTPVSVSWDVAFMGQFDRKKSELERALKENDLDPEVRDEIKRVLKKNIESKKSDFIELVKGLTSTDQRELLDAIFAAGEFMFPPEMKEQKSFVVNMLKNFLKTSDNYKVRSHALLSLTKLGAYSPEDAENLLRSKKDIERFVAAHHFMVLGTSKDLPKLRRALSIEEQRRVREMLQKAIDAIESREPIPSIIPPELRGE